MKRGERSRIARLERRLGTLQRLLGLQAVELPTALRQVAQILADVLGADKVDAFLYEPTNETLVAFGTSDTPMGMRQHAIGMDRLPVVNGGLAVRVFRSGRSYVNGRADADPEELRGITEGLGVKSSMGAPLEVAGARRGVLLAASSQADFFSKEDLDFLEAVAHWVGVLAHRAELVEQIAGEAENRGRRLAADELGKLTPREQQVAALVVQGLTNQLIAEELGISRGTAANHVDRIREKLELRRRSQIAAWAVAHGLHRPS
jgi:two-component system, OmpR family, sensor kinase